MDVTQVMKNLVNNGDVLVDASRAHNMRVMFSMLGPAARGFLLQKGKQARTTEVASHESARFIWDYTHDHPELLRLYEAAKRDQWNASEAIDWSIDVDPNDDEHELISDALMPVEELMQLRQWDEASRHDQKHATIAWMLSQFLHGEQGALFAACQVTEAVPWLDGKLYGSTQVVDEGRHVEVFQRYLGDKLKRQYQINDNLYVIIDAIMSDRRWDMKFLGMQIMIEGLALGAFATLRAASKEPLLREMLRYVITDEARHVHYGVVALRDFYRELSESERREREDWVLEVSMLLRNRFLAHELYDEYYAHLISRRKWNDMVLRSKYMGLFRTTMFRRIVPNLKRIGLLPERLRRHYEELGLMQFEHGKAAPELSAADLLSAD